MNLSFSAEDEAFRDEIRTWLEEHLVGEFALLRGRGGLGDMDAYPEERKAWEQELAKGGWTCVGWPQEHGGRGLSLYQEVIFNEEYARAQGPGRAGQIGVHLLGPTVIHFGNESQQKRFLPPIVAGTEMWCQGYSEPNAGSDLAALKTRAVRDGDEWVIDGQKIWTSLAAWSDWCFVLCRTDAEAPRHRGISCILVPMDQPGVTVLCPSKQITGSSRVLRRSSSTVRVPRPDHVVGPCGRWLEGRHGHAGLRARCVDPGAAAGFFAAELDRIIAVAKETGRRQRSSR